MELSAVVGYTTIWPVIELAGTDGTTVTIRRLSEGIAVAQPWQRP